MVVVARCCTRRWMRRSSRVMWMRDGWVLAAVFPALRSSPLRCPSPLAPLPRGERGMGRREARGLLSPSPLVGEGLGRGATQEKKATHGRGITQEKRTPPPTHYAASARVPRHAAYRSTPAWHHHAVHRASCPRDDRVAVIAPSGPCARRHRGERHLSCRRPASRAGLVVSRPGLLRSHGHPAADRRWPAAHRETHRRQVVFQLDLAEARVCRLVARQAKAVAAWRAAQAPGAQQTKHHPRWPDPDHPVRRRCGPPSRRGRSREMNERPGQRL